MKAGKLRTSRNKNTKCRAGVVDVPSIMPKDGPPPCIDVLKSNCDCSVDSLTTLLSGLSNVSWIADDEDSELESDGDNLVRSFVQRSKILDHICDGRSKAFQRMLRENEELVRQETFRFFEKKLQNGKAKEMEHTQAWRPTLTFIFWTTAVFDCHSTVRASVVLLCYCVAHLSIYETISSLLYENSRTVKNQDVLFFGVILFALVLSRLCGGLWSFLSEQNYLATKFDLHNRLRLHLWDAKILRWFIHHPKIKLAADHLAFYLAFIGVYYFQVKILSLFDQRQSLFAKLPSAQYGIKTLVAERFLGLNYARNETDACNNDSYCRIHEFHRDLYHQDEIYVWNHVSINSYVGLIGDGTSRVVSREIYTTYYFILASLAIACMTWMGCDFE